MCRDDDTVDNVTDADILRWDREKEDSVRPMDGTKWLRNKLDKAIAERNEIDAELDQWKTNFHAAADTANDIYEQKLEVLAELERVKGICDLISVLIPDYTNPEEYVRNVRRHAKSVHSTAESCRKAHAANGGGE